MEVFLKHLENFFIEFSAIADLFEHFLLIYICLYNDNEWNRTKFKTVVNASKRSALAEHLVNNHNCANNYKLKDLISINIFI